MFAVAAAEPALSFRMGQPQFLLGSARGSRPGDGALAIANFELLCGNVLAI